MPVTVVVGGQFGSEGKGKVAHHLAKEKDASVAVRVGGSNSGHTVIDVAGKPIIFRMLPTAAILPAVICVLGAGSYIDADILLHEIEVAGLSSDRLVIDPNAYVVTEQHKREELEWGLGKRIGSTQSGVGAAVVERARRVSIRGLARYDWRLERFISPGSSLLRARLAKDEHVIVEGTQGYGLSVLHSPYYPKATSRDTTAGTFIAEAGLSPMDVTDVVLVIRAFPIRVAGDSGFIPSEIDWATVSREGGWDKPLVEHTSVTKKIRRVGRFDAGVVKEAIEVNQPTKLVVNHVDYFDAQCRELGHITRKATNGLLAIEAALGRRVDFIGLGESKLLERTPSLNELLSA